MGPAEGQANLVKHGVSFRDAATAFGDPLSFTKFDPDRSDEEDRFILLGATDSGHLVVVVHTFDGQTGRIISARLATKRERREYASG